MLGGHYDKVVEARLNKCTCLYFVGSCRYQINFVKVISETRSLFIYLIINFSRALKLRVLKILKDRGVIFNL